MRKTTRRPTMGRPRKPAGQHLERLEIGLLPDVRAEVERRARAAGISRGEWIRRAVKRALR